MLMSASIALTDQKGKEKGKDPHSGDKAKGVSTHVDIGIFVGSDRDLIRHHYLAKGGTLPPGLAKRQGDLPPGLEKQLRRNGHLPPGLEKKLYPFPAALEQRLPPLRPGLTRGMIGVHAVIMDKKTSLILDVFSVL
jgi:hypothetical protein